MLGAMSIKISAKIPEINPEKSTGEFMNNASNISEKNSNISAGNSLKIQ